MKEYWVIYRDGFRGCREFGTYEEARATADRLKAISGQAWEPRKIIRVVSEGRVEG